MTLTERLAEKQAHQRELEQQIVAYQQEIQRLIPLLHMTQGQVALLMELAQDATAPEHTITGVTE